MKYLLAALIWMLPVAATAHEFVVKPDVTQAEAGETVAVSVMVTEVYMRPDRMPPPTTTLWLHKGAEATPIQLSADRETNVYRARPSAPGPEPFILLGHAIHDRDPATKGPNLGKRLRTESFSKALINTGTEHTQPLGTRLEIVPMADPAGLAVGSTLPVKILFDGKPIPARLQATWDGKTDEEHGYAVRMESDAQGLAPVPLSAPGLWILRTKHTTDETGAQYDIYEATANLVLRVE